MAQAVRVQSVKWYKVIVCTHLSHSSVVLCLGWQCSPLPRLSSLVSRPSSCISSAPLNRLPWPPSLNWGLQSPRTAAADGIRQENRFALTVCVLPWRMYYTELGILQKKILIHICRCSGYNDFRDANPILTYQSGATPTYYLSVNSMGLQCPSTAIALASVADLTK